MKGVASIGVGKKNLSEEILGLGNVCVVCLLQLYWDMSIGYRC